MSEMVNVVVICPHCGELILIEQLNCRIFRHGVLKSNNTQINPHASKAECDSLFQQELILGCGKPFRVVETQDTFVAEVCDYV